MLKLGFLKSLYLVEYIVDKGDRCRIKTSAYKLGRDVSICDQLNFV